MRKPSEHAPEPDPVSGMVPWPADWPPHYNGTNTPCDMAVGPCSCGAYHEVGEFKRNGAVILRRDTVPTMFGPVNTYRRQDAPLSRELLLELGFTIPDPENDLIAERDGLRIYHDGRKWASYVHDTYVPSRIAPQTVRQLTEFDAYRKRCEKYRLVASPQSKD